LDSLALARLRGIAADDLPVEVVERKGKGHPDSICDALAEEVSRALIREYAHRICLAGRATMEMDGIRIPVAEVAVESAHGHRVGAWQEPGNPHSGLIAITGLTRVARRAG
jgi:S-adenosylmethionine synthetase